MDEARRRVDKMESALYTGLSTMNVSLMASYFTFAPHAVCSSTMKLQNLDPSSFDRTDLVQVNEAPQNLPHDLVFHRLHYLACHRDAIAVKDNDLGLEFSYRQLLSDILHLKSRLLENLGDRVKRSLQADKEVSFVVLARGYEFIVAFFAILAIGGISVPTSTCLSLPQVPLNLLMPKAEGPQITIDEVEHIAKTCNAHGAVYSQRFEELALSLGHRLTAINDYECVSIRPLSEDAIDPREVKFFSGKVRDPNKPGLVIFTSGTTGKPKGAAMRRYNLVTIALMQVWKNEIKPGFVMLQMLPTHHATGLVLNTIPVLIGGGCVEITRPKFDASAIWKRIQEGGITSISAVPTIFVRLLQHWDNVVSRYSEREKQRHMMEMCKIRQFHCGSAALPRTVSERWTQVFQGTRITERYGGTEFVGPFMNYPGSDYIVVLSHTTRFSVMKTTDTLRLGIRRSSEPRHRILSR